jgi:hypothetical protein
MQNRTVTNLRRQVAAINDFLAVLYGQETRLSTILQRSGFDTRQIATLRAFHLEEIIASFLAALEHTLLNRSGNDRLYIIINRRFGLNGQTPETLRSIGDRLGISRERVRQLENKALRRCKNKADIKRLETSLQNFAMQAFFKPSSRP